MHPNTIDSIQRHVNKQAEAQQSQSWPKRNGSVRGDHRILMQRMKSDTTATGIVYRICQQVININHHCRNHRDPCPEKVLSKEHASHGGRYQEVQEQVDDWPDHANYWRSK